MAEDDQQIQRLKDENELLRHENRRLKALSTKDFLTQTLNRFGFLETASSLQPAAEYGTEKRRRDQRTLPSVLVVDIDNFKSVNDTHGNFGGDFVLRGIAKFLKTNIRADDILGRWDGEEFILAFRDATPENIIEKFGQKNITVVVHGEPLSLTFSGGVARLRPGETLETTISRANQALCKAKLSGKNRVVNAEVE